MSEADFELKERQIISLAFEKFNKALSDMHSFQQKLESQIKKLEMELSLKNQELLNTWESLSSGLIVIDMAQNILSINRAAKELTGRSEEEAKKLGVNKLFQTPLLPNELSNENLTQLARVGEMRFVYTKPTGQKIDLEIKVSPMREKDSGEILGVIVHLVDITPLKKLEELAERKNRLAATGQIAATVAHEIRNPLGGMELFVSLLKKDLKEPGQLEIIGHLQSAMRSMNHIITNTLEFANPRSLSFQRLDLAKVCAEFVSFYRFHAENSGAELVFVDKTDNSSIEGDPELMRQAILNLYMNAIQASQGGGRIELCLSNEVLYDPKQIELYNLSSLKTELTTLKLEVIDQGEGMTEEVKQKLFDPFFTTKQKGTGLGLSVLRQIVTSHHGTISVESTPGQGSKVSLQFPLAKPS